MDIWRTTYYHVMADAQAIVSWLQATSLRPFLASLDEAGQADFLAAYHQRLLSAYPAQTYWPGSARFPASFYDRDEKN